MFYHTGVLVLRTGVNYNGGNWMQLGWIAGCCSPSFATGVCGFEFVTPYLISNVSSSDDRLYLSLQTRGSTDASVGLLDATRPYTSCSALHFNSIVITLLLIYWIFE